MKIVIALFAVGIISSTVMAQDFETYEYKDNTHLWGSIDRSDLMTLPYGEWFQEYYDTLEISKIDYSIASDLKDVEVKIFLGTWCGDSKKWVPQFAKVWDELKLDENQLEYICLHNEGDNYKRGLNGKEENLNIHRVPTFIFYKDKKEIGRIVERPLNDLVTDIKQIASGVPSKPRYRAVSYLNEQLNTVPLDSLEANQLKIAQKISRMTSSAGELNTYGHVLAAAGKKQEALLVFKINALLNRFNPNIHDSLAEAYKKVKDTENALKSYYRVLELDPKNENAVVQVASILKADKEQKTEVN